MDKMSIKQVLIFMTKYIMPIYLIVTTFFIGYIIIRMLSEDSERGFQGLNYQEKKLLFGDIFIWLVYILFCWIIFR